MIGKKDNFMHEFIEGKCLFLWKLLVKSLYFNLEIREVLENGGKLTAVRGRKDGLLIFI